MPMRSQQRREQGEYYHAREQPGRDEALQWVHGHALQCVHLFGDLHDADFGRHSRTRSPGDDEGGEHRPEFADKAECDGGAEKGF